MKRIALISLAVLVFVALFAFVSCNENRKEESSAAPEETSSQITGSDFSDGSTDLLETTFEEPTTGETVVEEMTTKGEASSDMVDNTHKHSYYWEEIKQPNCTENAEYLLICNCGYQYVKVIPATSYGHAEVFDEAVPATCTETGLTSGIHCGVCGEVLVEQETIAALGHAEVVDAAVPATCTKTGLTSGMHCGLCGEVFEEQEMIAAFGHTEVVDEAVSATCTASGLTEGKHCFTCGEVFVAQEYVSPLGHSFVDWIVILDPTHDKDGLRQRFCSVCGYTESQAIANDE